MDLVYRMEFCDNCDNMLYIKVGEGEQDTLLYYCRRCGSESLVGEDKMCVSKTTFKRSDQKAVLAINEHTKLDPTLPRTTTIKCPNESCPSNEEGKESEVIYIRYNEENLAYVYLCSSCDTVWKTDSKV